MRLELAFRNVLRNRRRTALNLVMIAASCAAIIDFKGIANNIVQSLERVAVNGQYGHIQIANDKYWDPVASDRPVDRSMTNDASVAQKLAALPRTKYVSARLGFYSLITSGESSISARGYGFDPAVETGLRDSLTIIDGANFSADPKFQILVGSGLQKQLGIKVGAPLTLLANTFDGSVNAVDAQFVGVFQTGLSEIDNSTFYVSLSTAQRLLDTDHIDTYIVQLKSTDDVGAVLPVVAGLMPAGWSAKSWSELAVHYRKVRNLCDVINSVTLTILVVLALLAVANTVGMSIAERTGEIGTVRAMGDQRRDILEQFLMEGAILGFLGGLIGCVISLIVAVLVGYLKIPIEIPGNSVATSIAVDLEPSYMLMAFVVTFLMAIVATAFPAYVASQKSIIEALRKNI